MAKHEHEGEITFDKKLRCKLCGETLDSYEERISIEISCKRALRIIKEIAQAGEYIVSDGSSEFPVYTKVVEGLIIDITVRRLKGRFYEVVKIIHNVEVLI